MALVTNASYIATFTCPPGTVVQAGTASISVFLDIVANSYNLTSKSASVTIGAPSISIQNNG